MCENSPASARTPATPMPGRCRLQKDRDQSKVMATGSSIKLSDRTGGRSVDLGLLRTFTTAARLQNFHQTAERLYMAQPTVTSHIRSLERLLGFDLFERIGKRVRLTPAGERFLPHASRVLEEFEHALQDMTAWRQGYATRLPLVASPVVATSALPMLLKRFTDENPQVEVIVLTAGSPEIAEAVVTGKVHLGLSRIPSFHPDTTSEILYPDPVILVAWAGCCGPDGSLPGWKELLERHLVLTRNHPMYWDDLLLAVSESLPWLRTLEVDRVDVTKRMVEEGLGVSFLPRSAVVRELGEGRLVEVPVPDLRLPVAHTYLILPAERALPDPAHLFVEQLRREFAH